MNKVCYNIQNNINKSNRKEEKMQLDKENMKKIRWLIAFAVLLYLGVQNLDIIINTAQVCWDSSFRLSSVLESHLF